MLPLGLRLETVDLRLEACHPEFLRGGKRQCEECLRLLLVARVATGQQHAGVVVLGVRLPRPCPILAFSASASLKCCSASSHRASSVARSPR